MDPTTFITTFMSSVGISAAAAAWLARTLISHRLEVERIADKASIEGMVRTEVENKIGDRDAEREYAQDARKRLYTAIGPLRFQLLIACRDLAGRVKDHGMGRRYTLDVDGHPDHYYGRSTLFRILRPLCIAELLERQIAYADFAVDSGAVDLLRFKKGAFAAFSGGSLVDGHPKVNWTDEVQHLFFDHVTKCASGLIVDEGGQARPARFHEFDGLLSAPNHSFDPFPQILHGMTVENKPLFWTRLVGYGHLCNDFINRTGKAIGFEVRDYPLEDLLKASGDKTITGDIAGYVRRCDALLHVPL